MRIILASHNRDKIREFGEIISDPAIEWVCMSDLGFNEEIIENGHSYRENAEIKAETVFRALGGPVIADDSGLSVDALDGYPGIYSARFAGVHTAYPDKIERLQELLCGIPVQERSAAFHCAICYIDGCGQHYHYEAKVDGLILEEARGKNGFGYDPVFYLPDLGKTSAEISPEEKNRHSHRGMALRAWYRDWKECERGNIR